MKRRDFLKAAPVAVLPALLNGLSVKAFGASPLMAALSGANNDHVLVLIQLVGGNDGLNTVIPLDLYSTLSAARNNILIPQNRVLSLSGSTTTGLHPSLTGLQQLYNAGKLHIVHDVGYPDPNYSHFRATDIWLTGANSNQVLSTGWSGRYLNYEYPNFPTGYPNTSMPDPLAMQIGYFMSPVFQGPSVNMAMAVANPASIYSLVNGLPDPAPATPAGDELTYIRTVAQQTNQYAGVITNAWNSVTTAQLTYPANNDLGDQLKVVARLIAGGLKTRVYMVSMASDGSFDTHAAQVDTTDTTTGKHADLLKTLSDAVKTFQDDIQQLGVADRVVGMTFSEFGRRIISNSSRGTDHGAAAPLFIFGNKVVSGITGNSPTLPASPTDNDNVPMQYDFRSVYASLLTDWFCVPPADVSTILLANYQQLSLVDSVDCTTAVHDINQKAGVNLISNYPNPFTSSTNITFTTAGGHTMVQVFDGSGKLLRTPINQDMTPGRYSVSFENENYGDGVYYARFQNGVIQQVRTMIIAR
jgi:uncharacterized protein (DUF1501 family)